MNSTLFSEFLEVNKKESIISTDLIRSITYEDYSNYLSEDILVKVDRASMAASLEVRSPFLHPDIINLASKLPLKHKCDQF